MKTRYIGSIVALVLFLGGVGLPSAHASSFVIRVDDLSESITVELLANGSVALTRPCAESCGIDLSFTGSITIVSATDFRANIFDPGTDLLSDTYSVSAAAGSQSFIINFRSDVEGGIPLVPLTGPNVQTIIENGLYQSIGIATLSDGSTVDFQFRSDVEPVPEPSTLLLMGSGAAILALRKRSRGSSRN